MLKLRYEGSSDLPIISFICSRHTLLMPPLCCVQEVQDAAGDARSKAPKPLAALFGSKRSQEVEEARIDREPLSLFDLAQSGPATFLLACGQVH